MTTASWLELLNDLPWKWERAKDFIEHSVSFSTDSLHVLTGVVVQLGVAAILRRPISKLLPWTVVIVLLCMNEAADLLLEQWPNRPMQYGESARDLLLTLFLPTVLMITARFAPSLYVRRSDES